MARYVLDASAILAELLVEGIDSVGAFWRELKPEDELIGSQLLFPECTSVLRMKVARGQASEADAVEALQDLFVLPIRVCADKAQFSRAFDLATRFGHHRAYDMQHLATAEIEKAELVTTDGGMRQAAIQVSHPVRFLT